MNPILVGLFVLVGLVALFLMFFRRTKEPSIGGRPDELERPELTGTEQQKKRELP